MPMEHNEIGGYFQFGLSDSGQFPYSQALKYHSARSAFYDLLQNSQIEKIWMPKFICDSMIEPLTLLGITIYFYDLNSDFYPIIPEQLKDNEYLFYVNYFGVCTSIQKKLLQHYESEKIIFDHSQAFFVEPFHCFATIYSPRKFFPVAEGGLLVTSNEIVENYHVRTIDEMVQQYQHSLTRRVSNAAQGYNIFKENENNFNGCLPKKMSAITEDILTSLDYSNLKKRRLDNFKFLHEKLEHFNFLKFDFNAIESPLTYPFLCSKGISDFLIQSKIYTPTYWSDSLARISMEGFEHKLIFDMSHLICDQRYGLNEMQHQIDIVKDYLG